MRPTRARYGCFNTFTILSIRARAWPPPTSVVMAVNDHYLPTRPNGVEWVETQEVQESFLAPAWGPGPPPG